MPLPATISPARASRRDPEVTRHLATARTAPRATAHATVPAWTRRVNPLARTIRIDPKRVRSVVDTTQGIAKEDCIRVTTVHRVKGLEWKHVFIPECDEGRMPILGDASSQCFDTKDASKTDGRSDALESERRLFYVALTRASECCWISCGDEQARSRFVDDAMRTHGA